jgi:hypothetical protein
MPLALSSSGRLVTAPESARGIHFRKHIQARPSVLDPSPESGTLLAREGISDAAPQQRVVTLAPQVRMDRRWLKKPDLATKNQNFLL